MAKPFRKLAEEHRHRIYTFAYYSLRSREDAEDVTQEVLLRLWKHRAEIDPSRAGAWVMKVTHNAVLDLIRRRRTRDAVFANGVEVEIAANYAPVKPEAEAAVEATEFRENLEQALANVEEPYRSVVVMREIQDLKYAEIVEALQMPLNTVKVYLHRGRRMLREAMKRTA